MKKSEYGQVRFQVFVEDVSAEGDGKYVDQLRQVWNATADDGQFNPILALRSIKEADPAYRRTRDLLLASMDDPIGDRCCC
jgi:hypothetical protein